LEGLRPIPRLWTPIQRLFPLNPWLAHSRSPMMTMTQVCLLTSSPQSFTLFFTLFPDVIQGLSPPKRDTSPSPPTVDIEAPNLVPETHLGLPAPRDPDSLPPRNLFESFFEFLHAVIAALVTDNAIFAFKAGLLTVVLCLPSLIKSSAWFAYGVCSIHFIVADLTPFQRINFCGLYSLANRPSPDSVAIPCLP